MGRISMPYWWTILVTSYGSLTMEITSMIIVDIKLKVLFFVSNHCPLDSTIQKYDAIRKVAKG